MDVKFLLSFPLDFTIARFFRLHIFPTKGGNRFDSVNYKVNYSMDADYDIFEIVAVIRDFFLVDAESYQRKYWTCDSLPLTPGYYVVNWPDHIRARRFNEQATFHGPFKLREEAQKAQVSMYKQWRHSLTMSSVASPAAIPVSRRMEGNNVFPQGQLQSEGVIEKQPVCIRRPWIKEFSPSDHRKTALSTSV